MNYKKWLKNNTQPLNGKTVAITGATGGLGKEICRYILMLNGNLVLINRNAEKTSLLKQQLLDDFPNAEIMCFSADMEELSSVKSVISEIENLPIDILILNAAAYSIPRKITTEGFDNVFQINFVSPYFLAQKLISGLSERRGRVVVVGSIAHNYSKADFSDIDFSEKNFCNLVYGNSKRYLMYAMFELFKEKEGVTLSVVHPGITFTNITAHYPKWLFAIIKHPMKIIFMKPKKAALSIIKGIFSSTEYHTWIGPEFFDIWGLPKKKKLKTCDINESRKIFEISQNIFSELS